MPGGFLYNLFERWCLGNIIITVNVLFGIVRAERYKNSFSAIENIKRFPFFIMPSNSFFFSLSQSETIDEQVFPKNMHLTVDFDR